MKNIQPLAKIILTQQFYDQYDHEVSPYLSSELGVEMFGKPPKPHKKIMSMYDQFTSRIPYPYRGGNFVEVGVGAGGISFFASQAGFDVVCTDSNQTSFNKAWRVSRQLLNIHPIGFQLTAATPLSAICNFKNGEGPDYVYMDGVPFNKYSSDGSPYLEDETDSWYSFTDLYTIISDIFSCLNNGGIFLAFLMFGIDKRLLDKIQKEMEQGFDDTFTIKSHFYDALKTNAVDFSIEKSWGKNKNDYQNI